MKLDFAETITRVDLESNRFYKVVRGLGVPVQAARRLTSSDPAVLLLQQVDKFNQQGLGVQAALVARALDGEGVRCCYAFTLSLGYYRFPLLHVDVGPQAWPVKIHTEGVFEYPAPWVWEKDFVSKVTMVLGSERFRRTCEALKGWNEMRQALVSDEARR